MAGKIFINYRRGDEPGFTQALLSRLERSFLPEQLFIDIDDIEPGLDFTQVLSDQIRQCDVVLVVIGKGWIDACDEANSRRLENPNDFVRIEITSALEQDKRVIPVLVGDAPMPRLQELPDVLKPLIKRNAVRLTHERFRADTDGLIQALSRALNQVGGQRNPRMSEPDKPTLTNPQMRTQPKSLRLLQFGIFVAIGLIILASGGYWLAHKDVAGSGMPKFVLEKAASANSDGPRPEMGTFAPSPQLSKTIAADIDVSKAPSLPNAALTPKEDADAVRLYDAARDAEAGGRYYDLEKALHLYGDAAAAGSLDAMYALGRFYEAGKNVRQDWVLARQFYERAAVRVPEAMNNLGLLYELGKGGDRDYVQARQWYAKAADAGLPEGMDNLGQIYLRGLGVPSDRALARLWFEKAAKLGNVHAEDELRDLPPAVLR